MSRSVSYGRIHGNSVKTTENYFKKQNILQTTILSYITGVSSTWYRLIYEQSVWYQSRKTRMPIWDT